MIERIATVVCAGVAAAKNRKMFKRRIKMKLQSALVVAAFLAVNSLTPAYAAGVSVKFKNNSKWDIHSLYLSPVNEEEWGPDQLGDNVVIGSKTTFTLTSIEPDKYDMKLVDEDGDECIVKGLKLGTDTETVINDSNLLECQSDTEEEGEE